MSYFMRFYVFILRNIIPALVLLFMYNSCAKEYSYEGSPISVANDTTGIIGVSPPYICPSCTTTNFQENQWSFSDNGLLRCGLIDTAIANPTRTGFTFFGPSACAIDTGIIMTIILDTLHLNRDIYNVTYSRSSFYYYDNVGNTYIYMNRQQSPFTVTIESYTHNDRMITGSFFGFGYRANSGGSLINSGKFKVKLH
jgi:hypothetical protein